MATKSRGLESHPEISEGQPGDEGDQMMGTCQNCGWSQELCGEHDCHYTGLKTENNGECSAWEPDFKTYKKAWELAKEMGSNESCPPFQKLCPRNCVLCFLNNAMLKAIEGS